MRLVTYNIQFGQGKDGRFDLERIAREVEGADVIAMQEVERYGKRSDLVDQVAP
jgi:endonuclease/exonuclease/phosphatase family metal-dependent hydrolase